MGHPAVDPKEKEWNGEGPTCLPAHLPSMLRFWAVFGILVAQLAIEPGPPEVKVQGPNHWTAREVLVLSFWVTVPCYSLFKKTLNSSFSVFKKSL